jgi:hypothetical protein
VRGRAAVTQRPVQRFDSPGDEIRSSFEGNNPFATHLNFAVTGQANLLPPLVGAIPEKQVRTVEKLASVFDFDFCLDLERW